jgi:DnaK suppressor protein
MNEMATQHFKNKLITLRDQVRDEIRTSIDALPEEVRPVGEHDREPSEGLDKELALEHNEQRIYQAINAALERMEGGTFGQCIACGASIPYERLDAIPYTAHCIKCEQKIEAEK